MKSSFFRSKGKCIALVIVILSTLLLNACSDGPKREIKAGRYGMMSDETPQYAAIVFLLSIYENANLDETLSLATPKFANTIKAYHTNKSVQRHVLSLRLDNVEIEPVSGGFSPRSKYSKMSSVELKITGTFGGKKIIELKTIDMIKKSGDWKIVGVRNTVP